MLRFLLPPALLLSLVLPGASSQERSAGELFPPAEPGETGYLEVGDTHEIFYACSGNRSGRPVMGLHGGPGAGCYPRMTQYFDPDKFFLVLHDQRGAGRSRPHGELRGNTTQNLVEDIERLRKHLKLGKVLIFGGSWGSTLGLAYAETYPEHVDGLILRGVFLGTEAEIDHHYIGTRFFFPKEHEALLSVLPDPAQGTHPDHLFELIRSGDAELRTRVRGALNRFELKFMKLRMPDASVSAVLDGLPDDVVHRLTCLDLHYVTNRYFMEEGQLLMNIDRLAEIPVTLINGRYDMASPPSSAYAVHKALPHSKLVIVEEAGHSETEEGITSALVRAVAEFE